MLCLCTTLGQDGLTARLLVVQGERDPPAAQIRAAARVEPEGLLQRAGDIVLNPQANHVEANQDLLHFLSQMEHELRTLSKMQSREAAKIQRSIKRSPPLDRPSAEGGEGSGLPAGRQGVRSPKGGRSEHRSGKIRDVRHDEA